MKYFVLKFAVSGKDGMFWFKESAIYKFSWDLNYFVTFLVFYTVNITAALVLVFNHYNNVLD